MTRVVVDASVIAMFVLREEGWRRAAELMLDNDCFTLGHGVAEAANAVWKQAVLHGAISAEAAAEKMGVLERFSSDVLVVEPVEAYLQAGMEIALRSCITFYDAAYIAQALRLGAGLAALDQAQARAAEEAGVAVLRL